MDSEQPIECVFHALVRAGATKTIALKCCDKNNNALNMAAKDGPVPIQPHHLYRKDATIAITSTGGDVMISLPPNTAVCDGEDAGPVVFDRMHGMLLRDGQTMHVRSFTDVHEILRAHLKPKEGVSMDSLADQISDCKTDKQRHDTLLRHFPDHFGARTLQLRMMLKSRAHNSDDLVSHFTGRTGIVFNARTVCGTAEVRFVIVFTTSKDENNDSNIDGKDGEDGQEDESQPSKLSNGDEIVDDSAELDDLTKAMTTATARLQAASLDDVASDDEYTLEE